LNLHVDGSGKIERGAKERGGDGNNQEKRKRGGRK